MDIDIKTRLDALLKKIEDQDSNTATLSPGISPLTAKLLLYLGVQLDNLDIKTTLENLTDVEVEGPAHHQALVYDAEKELWVNAYVEGGAAGATNLNELADVHLSNIEDGESLVYNAQNSRWENKMVDASIFMEDIVDTDIEDKRDGQILVYDIDSITWKNSDRLINVETKASTLESRLNSTNSAVSSLQTRATADEVRIANLEADYGQQQSSLNILSSQITYATHVAEGALNNEAEEYRTDKIYNVGDFCIYQYNLYRCTAQTNGAWQVGKWARVKLGDEIKLTKQSATSAMETAQNAATVAGSALESAASAVGVADSAMSAAASALESAGVAYETAQSAAASAANAAEVAGSALSSAESAYTKAQSAIVTAASALSTATSAAFDAGVALSTASDAMSAASSAVSTASSAMSVASGAAATASSAISVADDAASLAAVAVLDASEAKSSAQSAYTIASAAKTSAIVAYTTASSAFDIATTAQTTAGSALEAAALAQTTASSAVTTANSAEIMAYSAATTASSALSVANIAATDASAAGVLAQSATQQAVDAAYTANSALLDAGTAITTANSAFVGASDAITFAQAAQVSADSAISIATYASNSAAAAYTSAATAVMDASTALATASSAATKASEAYTLASDAITQAGYAEMAALRAEITADNAETKANQAKTSAASALSVASDALTTASSALSTAITAVTDAATALATASSANTKADEAKTAASSALSVASSALINADSAYRTAASALVAAQIKSDWNAATGISQILNKPTIPDELADLSDDSTHRLVSDTEKAKWNATSVFKELTIEDLNDVKEVGFYVGKAGNTCTNKPNGIVQFGLEVVKLATDAQYYKQILTRPTNQPGDEYVRTCYNGTWQDWKKRVDFSGSYNDLDDQPTIPDISGKVSKSGDTMTGELVSADRSMRIQDITQARVFSIEAASGGRVQLHYAISGNHGLYSYGYGNSLSDTTAFTSAPQWIIGRNVTGKVFISDWVSTGSSTQPIYIDNEGGAAACTYSLEKSVPSDAIFTDEKVKIANDISTNQSLRILLGTSNNDNTITESIKKSSPLLFNPSTGVFYSPRVVINSKDNIVPFIIRTDGRSSVPQNGDDIALITGAYKKNTTESEKYNNIISLIGNTTDNRSSVRFGSSTGATIITAGANAKNFPKAYSKYASDALWLAAQSEIHMYMNLTANAASEGGHIKINAGGITVERTDSSVGTTANAYIMLGNSVISSTTKGSSKGIVRFYNQNSGGTETFYVNLDTNTLSENRSIHLPDASGTIQLQSTMSVAELTTGTATTSRTMRADTLKTGIETLIGNKIHWQLLDTVTPTQGSTNASYEINAEDFLYDFGIFNINSSKISAIDLYFIGVGSTYIRVPITNLSYMRLELIDDYVNAFFIDNYVVSLEKNPKVIIDFIATSTFSSSDTIKIFKRG